MTYAKSPPLKNLSQHTDSNGFRTDRGQGNRWHCITDKFENAQGLVRHIINNSRLDKRVCYENVKKRKNSKSDIYCFHYPAKHSAALALLQGKGGKLFFITFYPRLNGGGNLITLRLMNIHPWENRIEAVLECETINHKTPQKIYFFDTDYFYHKKHYNIGCIYPFELYAFCHTGEIVSQAERIVVFSGIQAEKWLHENHARPEYDAEGCVKPIHLRTDRAVVYQHDKVYPDFLLFQSPVISSERFRLMNTEMYRCLLPFYKKTDNEWELLPVFVRRDFLRFGISKGHPLRGMLTLQGRMVRKTEN